MREKKETKGMARVRVRHDEPTEYGVRCELSDTELIEAEERREALYGPVVFLAYTDKKGREKVKRTYASKVEGEAIKLFNSNKIHSDTGYVSVYGLSGDIYAGRTVTREEVVGIKICAKLRKASNSDSLRGLV